MRFQPWMGISTHHSHPEPPQPWISRNTLKMLILPVLPSHASRAARAKIETGATTWEWALPSDQIPAVEQVQEVARPRGRHVGMGKVQGGRYSHSGVILHLPRGQPPDALTFPFLPIHGGISLNGLLVRLGARAKRN